MGIQWTSIRQDISFVIVGIFSAVWVFLALLTAYIIRNRSIDVPRYAMDFISIDLYKELIEMPAFKTANITALTDRKWIDGLLHLSAYVQLIDCPCYGLD